MTALGVVTETLLAQFPDLGPARAQAVAAAVVYDLIATGILPDPDTQE